MDENLEEQDQLRKSALAQLRKKREFINHLLAYVIINLMLVVVWAAMSGWRFDRSFWPIYPIVIWGVGIVFHGLDTFTKPPSEERIKREMERLRTRRTSPV